MPRDWLTVRGVIGAQFWLLDAEENYFWHSYDLLSRFARFAPLVPICPIGTTPIIELGCYTGDCMDKADCPDGAPFACGDFDASEDACIANATCSPVYRGVNCTSQAGAECTSGADDCTCEFFELDRCDTVAP